MSSKNKGGREVRKPKQVKAAAAPTAASPVAKAMTPKKAK